MSTALPYDLLGIEFGDARIQALLTEYGLPLKRPKVKRGDFDAGIEVGKEGVDLVFSLVEAIPSMEGSGLPEGALVLSAVFLYPDAKGKRPGFKSQLPAGLSFNMSRQQVASVLGQPDSTSPVFPNDRWDKEGRSLIVDFEENEKAIDTVTIQISDA